MYGEKPTNNMADEETIEDLDLDEEVVETPEEEVATEEPVESEEDTTDWKAEALKQKAINARLAKKINKPQTEPKEQPDKTNEAQYLTREEGILIAQGLDDEAINKLKSISKGEEISLLKARESDLFQAWNDKREADRKAEKAKLGASKGSGSTPTKKTFKPGMTPEEHKAAWKEKMGQ